MAAVAKSEKTRIVQCPSCSVDLHISDSDPWELCGGGVDEEYCPECGSDFYVGVAWESEYIFPRLVSIAR